jgi:hypothetical protein
MGGALPTADPTGLLGILPGSRDGPAGLHPHLTFAAADVPAAPLHRPGLLFRR